MRHLEAKFSNWEPVLERSVTSSTLTLTFRLAYFHFAKLPFPPLARKYTTGTEDGACLGRRRRGERKVLTERQLTRRFAPSLQPLPAKNKNFKKKNTMRQ